MFEKYLQSIRNLQYDILDVKMTKWHDDYGQVFKEQIKNLEIIYQNIIALAFKNVSTVPDAIEMLENFDSLAKRPMVKEYVHKKAAEWVYKLFIDEIKEVEDLFDSQSKRAPPMAISNPKYGGLAIWANSLIVRIDKAKDAIDSLYFIPSHPYAKEAVEKYSKLRTSLDKFIVENCFQNWNKEIDLMDSKNIDGKLENQILVRKEHSVNKIPSALEASPLFNKKKGDGLLESNFDVNLLRVLIELAYWTKIQTLGFVTIPHNVSRLLGKREQLRIQRENVMLIVRDYNNIIHNIDAVEKALFKEHMESLDKTIDPGIKRLNWSMQADVFVANCKRECQDVFRKVKMF
jgi:dynein heavy chain